MKKTLILLTVVSIHLLSMATAAATPSWAGSAGTVHAEWTTWQQAAEDYVAPDYWFASEPDQLTLSDAPDAYIGGNNVSYHAVYEGRQDVLVFNAMNVFGMDFFMPNYKLNTLKEIWIQITYTSCGDVKPILNIDPKYSDPTVLPDIYGAYLESRTQHNDGWVTETYSFILFPNCDYEFIDLGFASSASGPVAVDSVIINTLCIPEPATMGILAAGYVLVMATRKRKAL